MKIPERPITILIAALGGEGGGVMADWLIDAAAQCDFPSQSTSIPGVAQRTGATTYYLEIFPATRRELGGKSPVFSLTPSPGNVDVMVASELIEAGRAMQNGYVSPERTVLIASTHRIYATIEKMQMGDGRFVPHAMGDQQRVARNGRLNREGHHAGNHDHAYDANVLEQNGLRPGIVEAQKALVKWIVGRLHQAGQNQHDEAEVGDRLEAFLYCFQ